MKWQTKKLNLKWPDQYRINNSSNSYGPGLLCVKLVLYYMQGLILEFRPPRQTLRKGAYILHMLYRNCIR